jgi:hypothetical protein
MSNQLKITTTKHIIHINLELLCWMNDMLVRSYTIRAGLHYGGEGLRSVKNAWPRHGYMRQMVDVPEKN